MVPLTSNVYRLTFFIVVTAGLVAVLVTFWIVPRFSRAVPEITVNGFVGAEACAECHQGHYDRWSRSTHGKAGGSPGEVTVIGKFDESPLVFKDAVVIPRVNARDEYSFVVREEGSEDRVFRVDAVVGGGHMAGGGTQSYFSYFDDGTLKFLPFDFIRDENTWFVQLKRGDIWVPVNPALSLDDLKNWPPTRILGDHKGFSNCQNCHGSQLTVDFDPGERRYTTRYSSLKINCESCHGPGRKHVEIFTTGGLSKSPDIGLSPLDLLPKDESINVCLQCHATKDRLKPGYLPGEELEAYYSLKLPILGTEPYLEDGRVRSFAYQQNHRYSDCYLNGSMTCVDCHDPHSLTYRDIRGNPLNGRFDNGQCVGCHQSKAEFPGRHTRHAPESPGSLCTSCHMPYFQQRGIGTHLTFSRSDHTISIPRPAFDASQGLEGACEKCHGDKSVEWLQAVTEEWYGSLKPHNEAVGRLLKAEEVDDPSLAASLLLFEDIDHPLAQMMGLSRFAKDVINSSFDISRSVAIERLNALSQSRDYDLQGLALAVLDVCCTENDRVDSLLANRLSGMAALDDPVRLRWGLALDFLASRHFFKGDFSNAVLAYSKAHTVLPDDPTVLVNRGHAHLRSGAVDKAIDDYEKAVRLDPTNREVLILLERLLGP